MYATTPDSCARSLVAITPADTDLAVQVRALYVGTGGDVKVRSLIDQDITFKNVASGTILPVMCKRVFTTGTTASNIVGLS
jgi:hypothetical protein